MLQRVLPLLLATLLGALPCAAWAQAAATSTASAPAPTPKTRPHVTVIEDDNVRIEETRVRGSVQRVTVQNKQANVAPYEIQMPAPGRDPSQEKGNAGKRTWSVLNF
jgi:hypothetical protein